MQRLPYPHQAIASPTETRKRYPHKPVFVPDWQEGTFSKWAKHFVDSNFWRVEHLFLSKEDALQECALIFIKCRDKYLGKVDCAPWFMSIFTKAVTRKWHSYSSVSTHKRDTFVHTEDLDFQKAGEGAYSTAENHDYDVSYGPLAVALAELPPDARRVLATILDASPELIDFMFHPRPPAFHKRFTAEEAEAATHRRIKRLCHLNAQTDIGHIIERLRDVAQSVR